jgi:nitrite reductase (NADH) large subunit
LTNGDTVAAGLVVLAMGVRPRDELARDVGIRCDLFGGIEIDECLQTSASNVYAIGECARYKGYNYGLVAPGYAMAEALAEHLAGGSVRFAGAEQNTRLKISGVELNVIGESNTDDVESRIVTAEDGASFRRLVVRNQRIVGATVVGPWDEMGALQDAVVRRTPLKERQERRFRARKPVWPQGPVPLAMWPDPAVVCTCTGTTCGTLRRLRADGATTVAELRQRTGASSVCGTCEPLLQTLVSGKVSVPGRIAYVTLSAAIVSLLLVLATVVSPPLGFATATSDTFQLDQLWRESLYKQITGFTLLGVVALETIISVRKRWARFQIGRFTSWRAFHTVMGALLLLGLVAHTGFRLGHHLDRWLVSFLLLSTAVGGAAAILAALETRYASPSVMTLRRWLAGAHLWLLWPLPVLIAAHVIKVYFF